MTGLGPFFFISVISGFMARAAISQRHWRWIFHFLTRACRPPPTGVLVCRLRSPKNGLRARGSGSASRAPRAERHQALMQFFGRRSWRHPVGAAFARPAASARCRCGATTVSASQTRHACPNALHGDAARPPLVVRRQLAVPDELIQTGITDTEQQTRLPRRYGERFKIAAAFAAGDSWMDGWHAFTLISVRARSPAPAEK